MGNSSISNKEKIRKPLPLHPSKWETQQEPNKKIALKVYMSLTFSSHLRNILNKALLVSFDNLLTQVFRI